MFRDCVLLLVILIIGNRNFSHCERTYSEEELSPFFESDLNDGSACSIVEHFFANKSIPSGNCIRYKQKGSKDPTMYCLGKTDIFRNHSYKLRFDKIETLIICQFNGSTDEHQEFDLNFLKYFTRLKDLIIENSSFKNFIHKFPKLDHLRYINVSQTALSSIKSDFFINLPSIQIIDLSYNKINVVEKLMFSSTIQPASSNSNATRPIKIFLRGNFFNCTKHLKWMALDDFRYEILDRNNINCTDQKYRARPLLTVMNYKLMLHKFCHDNHNELRNCSCHISYLRLNDGANEYQPMYSVNCSYAGFFTFPKRLPQNTTTLFIAHNNITSLEGLCQDNYKDVYDIYVDYNKIRNVESLENCRWFQNFRVLSLRGNYLEKIPVYVFRNNLEKNAHALKIYLSDNPWHCSCKFGPRLLTLSLKYDTIIDKEIICWSEKNDNDVYGFNLHELTRNEMCQINDFPLDTFEILSIIFLILIIVLISNLVYDYYNYKSYGKLPWIANKIPYL